jgi:hypothetical protein
MRIAWKRAFVVLVTIIAALAFVLPVVMAQEATDDSAAGSPSQLILRRPFLGFELIELADSPDFYEEYTLGGGDVFIDVGGDCVTGYTGSLALLGVLATEETGPLEIGFAAQIPGNPVALILWNVMAESWTCSLGFADTNFLEIPNLSPGIYYVWVLTETDFAISGDIFVRAGSEN